MIICTMPGCQTTAGCQCGSRISYTPVIQPLPMLRAQRDAIIEECAREVEARAYDHDDMVRLAAAIRALKDKP